MYRVDGKSLNHCWDKEVNKVLRIKNKFITKSFNVLILFITVIHMTYYLTYHKRALHKTVAAVARVVYRLQQAAN